MSHIYTKKWLLNRRHVLRGMGATIALPLLNCMLPSQSAASNRITKPKRCVFVYIPNGVNPLTWQIKKSGTNYELTQPLMSLAKHRDVITPISGLHHPNGIGQAHMCDKIWLTGAKIGRDFFRNTVSADQLMAQVTSQFTRYPSIELAITGGTLAWTKTGVPLPAERKPSAIFNRMFGNNSEGIEQARERLRRRGSVLDLILDDARSFRRTIGSEDKIKLDEYLYSVRDVELRTERADSWLETPLPKIDSAAKAHFERNIPYAQAGEYYRTVYDLMVLALRTDMTRVITCMSGSESYGLALPEIGINQSRHELSHHNGDPKQMQRLTQCDTFLTEQFSYFLDELQSYAEQGESLLDRTMVLFGSGMSHGHSHGNANLPMILAGGKSLGLSHGRHIDFNLKKINDYDIKDIQSHYSICTRPVDSNAHLSNLLLTMLQRMDVKTDRFGDSNGIVSELLKH